MARTTRRTWQCPHRKQPVLSRLGLRFKRMESPMKRAELSGFRSPRFFLRIVCGLGFIVSSHAYAANGTAIPALSGQWGRDMLFFEPPASGPGPVVRAERVGGEFKPLTPCCEIVQSWFGDPNNPILKPNAAEAVRRNSE